MLSENSEIPSEGIVQNDNRQSNSKRPEFYSIFLGTTITRDSNHKYLKLLLTHLFLALFNGLLFLISFYQILAMNIKEMGYDNGLHTYLVDNIILSTITSCLGYVYFLMYFGSSSFGLWI